MGTGFGDCYRHRAVADLTGRVDWSSPDDDSCSVAVQKRQGEVIGRSMKELKLRLVDTAFICMIHLYESHAAVLSMFICDNALLAQMDPSPVSAMPCMPLAPLRRHSS